MIKINLDKAVPIPLPKIDKSQWRGSVCGVCGYLMLGMAADCRCTKYGYKSWFDAPRELRPWYLKWLP